MRDEIMKIAELFHVTAGQLRRLGRGPITKDEGSLTVIEAYVFKDEMRTANAFPHDQCFETANRLEEFAQKLEALNRQKRRRS